MSEVLSPHESVSLLELPEHLSDTEFDAYIAALDSHLDAMKPFVMIVDGSVLNSGETMEQSIWHRRRATRIKAFHRGVVFITGLNGTRDRVRLLCQLQPPKVPYAFVSTREEALSWATQRLTRRAERESRRKTVSLRSLSAS